MIRFVGACLALALFAVPAFAADDLKVSGSVLKLAEMTPANSEVNVGGLVVVYIPDSGSQQPGEIKVVPNRALSAIGVVQGSQNEEGIPLTGGGYTLYLFKATTQGAGTVDVSYKLIDGETFKKSYKFEITAADATEQ